MSPIGNSRSLIAFAICLAEAFVFATPLTALENQLSRRDNSEEVEVFCGNAPSTVGGDPLAATNIFVPSQDVGPPLATEDPSGYFPYLWCGAGTSTYVYIDPIGSYGYNKGTNNPIFWTGLDGAYNATQNAMSSHAAAGVKPNGDGPIGSTPLTWRIPLEGVAGNSGIQFVELFAQNTNHQKLTWGVYGAALTIMKDFVLTYPLYADASYFQINDGKWGTLANGYMGIGLQSNTTDCYLKGNPAQNNGVICAMPSNYPSN